MIKRKTKPPNFPSISVDLWSPKYIACVCTKELAHEVLGWLVTVWGYTKAIPIIIGDYTTVIRARHFSTKLNKDLIIFPWLAGSALSKANIKNVKSHSSYWKEKIIWWKCEGFRRLFEYGYIDILFTDSDITFINDIGVFKEEVILSPFYWGKNSKHVENQHGTFNAGYLAARTGEFAKRWLQYYEAGIGDFYEQGCLNQLANEFNIGTFSQLHNHGKWREVSPHPNCISLHYHRQEVPKTEYDTKAQVMAERAIKKMMALNKFDYNLVVNYDYNMQSP